MAERCRGKELLATFFFSRTIPHRNNAQYVALAIADGISMVLPGHRKSITQTVRKKPGILYASVESQFETLVIEPFTKWINQLQYGVTPSRIMAAASTLVIMDGLDCLQIAEQKVVLEFVSLAMEKKLPLRFLICSRPKRHLEELCYKTGLHRFTKHISLDDQTDVD
ncbi:hypothetical protein L218DRAFT_665442 [Marasmius fiardii PR-910]|nr:hypothetical protein L218DRAFT_665442 [Marasmius fiardii PR-910]